MKIITYLAFTLLSIVIQFCVMDFIQHKLQENDSSVNWNITYKKRDTTNLNNEPYALFLRTYELTENISSTKVSISSPFIDEIVTQPGMTTTELDVFYDNVSITENYFTTESIYFSNEYENVTELNIFNKKNSTLEKPVDTKSSASHDKCSCNLLYKMCDVNCCCDSDCSVSQTESFPHCVRNTDNTGIIENVCYSLFQTAEERHTLPGDLFCVAKTNIPDKRDLNIKKYDALNLKTINSEIFKWHTTVEQKLNYLFTKKLYGYGDPIWIMSNNTVNYIDLPIPTVNNYCSGRESMKFLNNEHTKCIVKIKDLEMFRVLKHSEETLVLSVTEKSLNNTILNCTTAHCTNWTILTCDGTYCTTYNRSLNEPVCTDTICTNLAHKVDYVFYYYDKKIINVTVKLYLLNISTFIPFITQTVNVKFYLTNETGKIVELSGNPGYIQGLPVIVSYAKENYTENFFNVSSKFDRYLLKPDRGKGDCKLKNNSDNYVRFNSNERVRCRYLYENTRVNYTDICEELSSEIRNLLRLDLGLVVSPYGNPKNVLDDEWRPIQIDDSRDKLIYGIIDEKHSAFQCFNLITRISIVFTYADVSEDSTKTEHKILSAETFITKENISFNMDDISMTITIDVTFVDITKPPVYEFAGSPHINIHLPKDFFFPFNSNESASVRYNWKLCLSVSCILSVIYQQIK